MNDDILTPSDVKKPLNTSAIIGIAFAASMAGLLLIGVLAAIFVPGVRYLVATNAADAHPTQRSVLSGASRANMTHNSSDKMHTATSPRNGTISTTSSDSESSEEVPMKKVKRVKKSGTPKKAAPPAVETSEDQSDSNYDSV